MTIGHIFASLADSPVPDRELLDRFRRSRDENAFTALVRRHGPTVLGVCRRVVGDHTAAEDAFQAAFLVLVLRADDAGRVRELGAWLHGVALRTALKARRAARRTAARELTGQSPPEPAARPEPAADWLPVLDEELAALADKYRLPVLLCDVQGLTLRAAADRLGVPVGTLSERLAKARGSLAGRLAKRGVGPAVLAGLAAELPAGLAAATAHRAALVARGGATVLPAVELSRGVVRAMWWTKWKGLAAAVTVAAAGAGTVGVAHGLQDKPAAKPAVGGSDLPAGFDVAAWADLYGGGDFRTAGEQLKRLPPADASAVIQKAFDLLRPGQHSNHLFNNFASHLMRDGDAAPLLDALDRAMRHPNADHRNLAVEVLKDYALRDFAEDFAVYETWYAENRPRKLAEVALAAARRFATDGTKREAVKLFHHPFRDFVRAYGPAGVAAAREAKLPEALLRLAVTTDPKLSQPYNEEGTRVALAAVVALLPTMDELKQTVFPLTADDRPAWLQQTAARVLIDACRQDNPPAWLRDFYRGWLPAYPKAGTRDALTRTEIATHALAELKDDASIPTMIAVIASDDSYDTVYGVGYFGLGKLTGVRYDESHKGAWWKDWWAKNKAKYPPAVRDLTIPDYPKVVKKPAPAGEDDPLADVKDTSSVLRAVGDRGYLLVGKADAPPAGGYKLLVVLPGGDGGADFNPFVRRVRKNALGDDWLVAQALAPQQVVWPTEKLNPPAEPTEKYLSAVVADVAKRAKIDPAHVYLFGWSSGGPACYAALLREGSPFAGAFVAMSVYKPDLLPPRTGAKGKGVYLLQSPDDTVTAMRWADAAAKELGAAGARVKLTRYEGGHGWHGDVFANIKAGVEWLTAR